MTTDLQKPRFGITFCEKRANLFVLKFQNLGEAEEVFHQLGKQFQEVCLHDNEAFKSNGVTSVIDMYRSYKQEGPPKIQELPPEEIAERVKKKEAVDALQAAIKKLEQKVKQWVGECV